MKPIGTKRYDLWKFFIYIPQKVVTFELLAFWSCLQLLFFSYKRVQLIKKFTDTSFMMKQTNKTLLYYSRVL